MVIARLEIINCPAASAGTYSFNVTASGSSDYTVAGTDREGSVDGPDPNVYVHVGDTIEFAVSASSHPFYIRESILVDQMFLESPIRAYQCYSELDSQYCRNICISMW